MANSTEADPTERDTSERDAVTRSTPAPGTQPTQGASGQTTTRQGTGVRLGQLKQQQLLAYALIAFGGVLLLTRLGGADWLWLALLGGAFLLGYVSRKSYGFLVAGGVLMGVAVGTLIDTQSGFLLSLAAGFFVIDRIEPKPNRWALWTAAIFAVLGALGMVSVTGLLSSVGFALVLIAGGAYLLLRDRPGFPPRDTYQPTDTQRTDTQRTNTQTTDTQRTDAKDTYSGETYASTPPTAASTSPATAPKVTTPGATSPAPYEPAPTATQPTSATTSEPAPVEPPLEATSAPTPPPLSPEAEARLRRLEAWRRETAAAEGTPAYIVFSNDTLAKIAVAEPRTLEELDAVKGVGPIKLERYGEAVLKLVRDDAAPAYEVGPN